MVYVRCPECGRTTETIAERRTAGFGGTYEGGLDLDGCEGCRKAWKAAGGAVGTLRADGTWEPRPAGETNGRHGYLCPACGVRLKVDPSVDGLYPDGRVGIAMICPTHGAVGQHPDGTLFFVEPVVLDE